MIYQDRPYQLKADADIRSAFASGHRRVLFVGCCGSGKTVIFGKIAQSAMRRDKDILIMAHRKELIMQASDKLTNFGVEHGIVKAGIEPHYERHIQVGSVQTIINHLEDIRDPDLIIPDEGHHSQNETQQTIILSFPEAKILSVTASPIFGNGRTLHGYYDVLVQGPNVRELVDDGYLVHTRVFAPPMVADLSGIDYEDNKELEKRMNKRVITGNAIEHYTRMAAHWPAIAYCTTIRHADDVAGQFQDSGYKFHRIDGTMNQKQRDNLIEGFKHGEVEGLSSVDLIGEGTDVPRARIGIKLAPGRSLGRHIQNDGRFNRPDYAKGYNLDTREERLEAIARSAKPYSVIMDHVNNMYFNGLPDDDFVWSLDKPPVQTRAGGSTVPIQVCQSCDLAFPPASKCPYCGHVAVIKERVLRYTHGQLVEIKKSEVQARKVEEERIKKLKKKELKDAKTFSQLCAFAKKWQYENPEGWAAVRFKFKEEYRKKFAKK